MAIHWAAAKFVRVWAWLAAAATHATGCGYVTLESESDTACSAGCAHEFAFDVPGGVYVVRARLTARVYGDLDYGPAEYARVLVDGSQHGAHCFGSKDEWISCADEADVTGLLLSRNGASRVHITLQSSAGVSSFSARAALVLDFSVTPWLGPVEGGTQVIFGSGCLPPGPPADWICAFALSIPNGADEAPAQATVGPANAGAACVTPPLTASGWYNVTVHAAGVPVSPTVRFYAYGSVTGAAMHSANMAGSLEANTAVRLSSVELDGLVSFNPVAVLDRGRGFEGGCAFGATYTNLVYDFATETFACLSPAGTGSVPLTSVALNSQQHAYLPGVTLARDASLSASIGTVQSVTPIAVPRVGGTRVSLRTGNLAGTEYRCLFDHYAIVNAEFSAIDDIFNCTFPSTAYHRSLPHTLSLQIASDAVHFSDDTTTLHVYSVSGLHCAYGPAAGGHVVVVHGSGFIDESNGLIPGAADANRKYRFAHDDTAYIPLNGTTSNVTVVSPPGVAGTQAAVDITFIANEPQCQNDVLHGCYTADKILYSYIFVSSLLPTSGPASGGTNVTVTGLNFGTCERVSCRFGTVIVDAFLINSSALWCISPPLQTGNTSVDVSMNGVDFSATALEFVYYDVPVVTYILPPKGSQYSCNNVSVHGVNFTNGSSYACRFGSLPVSASLSTTGTIQCACTISPMPRTVVLEISLNGQQYTSSGVTFEFAESRVLSLSDTSGAATGSSTVDVRFSFPGPRSLEYLCVWNGYPAIGEYIAEDYYDNAEGVPIGTVRCETPRADEVPFTYGRTSFEEVAVGVDAIAQSVNCRSEEESVGEVLNAVGEPVAVFGRTTQLLYSSQGLQFGQGRWELAFTTFRRNTTTVLSGSSQPNTTNTTNAITAHNNATGPELCPKQYIGVVQSFTEVDGTQIRPQSGQNMYVIHGSTGFIQAELESVNLTNTSQSGANLNVTFSCWMRIGNWQTTNNARIWVVTDTGEEIVVWQLPETEEATSAEEPVTQTTISVLLSLTVSGRASAAAISETVKASIPSNFGNATASGLQAEVSAYSQVVESAATVADANDILRDYNSAQGQAARAQFQFGTAVVAGVDVENVNVSAVSTDPSSSSHALVMYTIISDHDIFPRFAIDNISAVFAASVSSAGTQLDMQPSDVSLGALTFSTFVKLDVRFEVNRTDNVSDVVDEMVRLVTNESLMVHSLHALNASTAADIAHVNSLNLSASNATFREFVAEPEPEPVVSPGQEVDQYRSWQEFSFDVDTSVFASAVLKFGASLEYGNESYFVDNCQIYSYAELPNTATVDIKALHGMTVEGALFSLHAPYIVSIYPASGVITGDTVIRAEINYPGVASSTVNCSFNGMLQPASYASISSSAGVITCSSPHLGFCSGDGTCVTTESLSTLALPTGVTFHLQIDGIQSSNSVVFTYSAVPHLSYIWPVSGVSSESVLIVGEGLSHGTDYKVRFGEISVLGSYQENSCEAGNCRVLCVAPGGNAGTVVTVEISLNGQQFTTSGTTFTYTDVNECMSSPCLHGADCLESADTPDIAVGKFSCICTSGWQGDRCHVDTDECASGPCRNSAGCIDSTGSGTIPVGSYVCDCVSGWDGTHCELDVNECLSHPCHNGGSCSDSTSLPSVHPGQFACSCVSGYSDNICSTDVNECTSSPCTNGATCTESSDINSTVPVDAYSCSCAEGFANGLCAYAFVAEYAANCSIQIGGHCNVDVDECVSQPCKNGAECAQSGDVPSILPHGYTCACTAGYANGLCSYDFIDEYSAACSLPTGGNCDVDVDECASLACKSESLCVESSLLRHRTLLISEYMEGTAYNDAIEVFNPTCREVDLSEYKIWKVSNGGQWGEDATNSVPLQGFLAPGQVFVLCNKQFDMTLTTKCDYIAQTANGINFDGDDAIALTHGTTVIDTVGQAGVNPGDSWTLLGSASTRQHTLRRKRHIVTGNTNWSLGSGILTADFADLEWTAAMQEAGSNSASSLGSHQADVHCDRYALNSYVCLCKPGWDGANCAIDINECSSEPCRNGGTCSESSTEVAVAVNAYRCRCAPGFANGTCHDGFISAYTDVCAMQVGGHCDIDMDECASFPCEHGAACSDSSVNNSISFDAFSCACVVGYASGLCTFDAIEEYRALCEIREGGRCNIDINECASHPCVHGATCTDSAQGNSSNDATQVVVDAYSCACKSGFANGICNYAYIQPYTGACAVQTGGRCNIDVNECSSNPCMHTADCYESMSDGSVGPGYFSCSCKPGYNGIQCENNINECNSSPCVNNGTCIDLLQTYSCKCLRGWDGDECQVQINICERDEDDCSEHATCIQMGPGSHFCNCHRGYEFAAASANASNFTATVCVDINECQSEPCSNAAICGNLADAYNCTCGDGYAGWTCEINVDECSSYPCANGATCVDGVANFSCTCTTGYTGRTCAVDFDECSFHPCLNGATCDESSTSSRIASSFFTCTCAPGFTGENCTIDIDECASQPCWNGATCTESTSDDLAVVPDAYHCNCASGYAEGWCSYAFMPSYLNACRNVSGGHCSIDVDECSSHPCANGATCAESSQMKSVVPNAYSCFCAPGFANGKCDYDFIPEYRSVCSIDTAGRCDIDVDECASIPCLNNAKCVDSSRNHSVPVHAYTCECRPGFANGWCEGAPLAKYQGQCTKQFGGHCDVDIDECSSGPCKNGATCSDSSTDPTVEFDAYKCTCDKGFANGMCHYLFVRDYSVQCSLVSGGACDVDVDECASNPCQNGATCIESNSENGVSRHAYRCTCAAGFANGHCSYDYVRQYEALCTVVESDSSASLDDHIGNCDVDVDECASSPCKNAAFCSDSTTISGVSKHAYRCTCAAGFSNGMCGYNFIAEYASECRVTESSQSSSGNCDLDVDECSSSPCVNGGVCSGQGIDAFQCKCVAGYDGYVCSINVAECASEPCLNSGTCSEENVGPDQYACTCARGFAGGNCAVDIDECASTPCQHSAPCTDGIDLFRCGLPLEVQLVLALDLNQWQQNREYWSNALKLEISEKLGVDISRIKIISVGSGSVTVDIEILPAASEAEVDLQEAGSLFAKAFIVGDTTVGSVLVVSTEASDGAAIGCPDGFQGLDCSIDVDECASNPCAHLGSCVDQVAGYRCNCQIGWSGQNCLEKLQLSTEFKILLSNTVILSISVGATAGPIVLYILMTRVNFDINTQHFSYSAHAISSTMAVASASIGSITFASYVRPATVGLLAHFRMMAPLADLNLASLALPCPQRCSHAGTCLCPMGYEVESATGKSLCIAEPVHCSNQTYQFCAAVMGDSSTTDSLTVDSYASCDGPCDRVERSIGIMILLLSLGLAALSLEWASVVANGCTHLHRVPACLPRWEWMLPPMFLVFVILRLTSAALQACVAVTLWILSREIADLLLVNCFEEESVFVLDSVEQLLGMAFGTCVVNVLVSLVNLGTIVAGFLLARASQSSAPVGYLQQPRQLMKLPLESLPSQGKIDDATEIMSSRDLATWSRRDRRVDGRSRVTPHSSRDDISRQHTTRTPPEDQPSEPSRTGKRVGP